MSNWLKWTKKCTVVATDLRTQNNETPDVIGFYGAGGSTLIECKISRSDFLADRIKLFRKYEDMGVGDLRYFAAMPSILKPEDLPAGWGLLEVMEHGIRELIKPAFKEANKRAEVKILMSILRRLEISAAVFVRQESDGVDEITPVVAKEELVA